MITRDAKIGLLVGLAFILIVGILLSEHVTSATAPRQAQLAQAGDRVRRAVDAPLAPQPKVADARVESDPQPTQSVVTREQLDAPPTLPPTARVELGAPRDGQIKVIRVDGTEPSSVAQGAAAQPSAPMLAATTETPAPRETPHDDALHRVAREQGMDLVLADAPHATPAAAPTKPAPLPAIPNGSKVKEYVAQTGDSLGRIAARQLGANTPANRQLIVSLNPSLQKDNDRILVGAKYLLPADVWASALGGEAAVEPNVKPAAAKKQGDQKPAADAPPSADTKQSTTVLYVVKAGDSLWKIADHEVGTPDALAKIKALNADILDGEETVKVGMKLRLPARGGRQSSAATHGER